MEVRRHHRDIGDSVLSQFIMGPLFGFAYRFRIERQFADGNFATPNVQGISAPHASEHQKRLQIISVGAGVIIIGGPEVYLARSDTVIRMVIGKTAVHCVVPRETNGIAGELAPEDHIANLDDAGIALHGRGRLLASATRSRVIRNVSPIASLRRDGTQSSA
jgi:hypothetical protein